MGYLPADVSGLLRNRSQVLTEIKLRSEGCGALPVSVEFFELLPITE
jgi:hypothetical protein